MKYVVEGASQQKREPGFAWWNKGAVRDVAAVFLLIALWWVFVWRFLSPDEANRLYFPDGDFIDQFYNFAVFEAKAFKDGRLPLWNPYTYAGHPFLADVQSAIFYPISLLVTWFAILMWGEMQLGALEFEALIHFFLASLFMYFFVRRLTGHRGAAFLSAITFSYSGYLTGYPPLQLAVLESDIWLPLVLLLVHVAVSEAKRENSAVFSFKFLAPATLCGLILGVVILAGHPQSAMYVFYAFLAYTLFESLRHPALSPRRVICLVAFPVGIALLASAAQWLPLLEYMRLSVRASATYEFTAGGFPFRDIVQMVFPGTVSLWSPLYVGVLPLVLAGGTALLRRSQVTAFWAGFGGIALLLSFGGNTVIYRLAYLVLPGFDLFRSQERAAFLVAFALSVLAGYGARTFAEFAGEYDVSWRHSLVWGVRWIVIIGGLLSLLAYLGWMGGGERGWALAGFMNRAIFLTILAVLTWGILKLRAEGKVTTRAWWAVAIAVVVFDLFSVNADPNAAKEPPSEFALPAPLIYPLQADTSLFRVYNEWRLPGNYGVLYEIQDIWGASPLRLARYARFNDALPRERVWKLLNVKYVVTWQRDLPGGTLIGEAVIGDETSYLHRLTDIGPRFWIVGEVVKVTDEEALARLADSAFDPWRVALVAPDAPDVPLGGEDVTGEVRLLAYAPERILLEAELNGNGLLIMSENWYPGWKAFVDGKPAPVLRAYTTLRAVPVPAGTHQVEMRFDPWTVRVGLWISLLTWIGCVVGLGIRALPFGKRRHAHESALD